MTELTGDTEEAESVEKKSIPWIVQDTRAVALFLGSLLPCAAAWVDLSPWAALPLTITNLIASIGLAKGKPSNGFFGAGVIGGLSLFISSELSDSFDPAYAPKGVNIPYHDDLPDDVQIGINNACWKLDGKPIRVAYGGKTFLITIDKIIDNSGATIEERTASGSKINIQPPSHFAQGTARYSFHRFWTDKLVNDQLPVVTSERPGIWSKKLDRITINGQVLACN